MKRATRTTIRRLRQRAYGVLKAQVSTHSGVRSFRQGQPGRAPEGIIVSSAEERLTPS
jgi:hypothetical protein